RGIRFHTGTKVHDIRFSGNAFHISLHDRIMQADLVIGAWGKRSNLDQKLNRRFFYRRSPFMAVKYHVRSDFPEDLIQLDFFRGGYSGICRIEGGQYSLCYLSRAETLKRYGSLREMEREVLFSNPALRAHMEPAEYLSGSPHVINQISFESKPLTGGHVLFCGDSAGMISPLFGNGMAIAIRSGKFLAEVIHLHLQADPSLLDRSALERQYEREWQRNFRYRIGAGRLVQSLFMRSFLADAGIRMLGAIPGAVRRLVENSHGRPF
ncbi:MAG TPA: FAD-dependent oxidoreductase, partial [Sphingobacteriaceae bacterium]